MREETAESAERARSSARLLGLVLRKAHATLADDRQPFDGSRLDRRDPELVETLLPLFERLNASWLKLRVDGVENIPREPALFVGNHSGGIMGPDLSCTLATLWRRLGPAQPVYALAHDLAMRHLEPLGRLLQRVGCMRADPQNAHRALTEGGHVLVYPGGELDAFRHYRDRHRVVFGRRAGFVRVAQRARVPIVPIVAHGAHASCVILDEGEWLARVLRLSGRRLLRVPIALALPWGVAAGPLPYFPLPLPVRLEILPAQDVHPEDDPAEVRDVIVGRMQEAMDRMAGSAP